MIDKPTKYREDQLRLKAQRRGLRLHKTRRRDPMATDFHTYQLTDLATGRLVAAGLPGGYGLTLEEVMSELDKPASERQLAPADNRAGRRQAQVRAAANSYRRVHESSGASA